MVFNYKSEKGMGLTKSQQGTFVTNIRLMAVNITKTYDAFLAGTGTRTSVYDCTRHYWRAKLARAWQAEYVLGVAHGKVVAVYRPKEWHYTSNPAYSGRIAFTGDEIVGSAFIGMDLTAYFKNRNPVRYIPMASLLAAPPNPIPCTYNMANGTGSFLPSPFSEDTLSCQHNNIKK